MKKWVWIISGYALLFLLIMGTSQAHGSPMDSAEQPQVASSSASVKEFKLMLHEVPGSSEWVRVEKKGSTYRIIHSRCLKSGVSNVLASVVPFASFYTWYDHPVTKIIFLPRSCQPGDTTCTSTSTGDSLDLGATPISVDGMFTIEYSEGGFTRSVTFSLPASTSTLKGV